MANYNDKKTLNPYRCKDCSKKNMFSCSHVFQKKTCPHVLMSFKKNMSSCSHVFQTKTCPHVPMSFKKKHVLLSFQKPCSHVSTCPHSKIKDTFIQLKFSFCVII